MPSPINFQLFMQIFRIRQFIFTDSIICYCIHTINAKGHLFSVANLRMIKEKKNHKTTQVLVIFEMFLNNLCQKTTTIFRLHFSYQKDLLSVIGKYFCSTLQFYYRKIKKRLLLMHNITIIHHRTWSLRVFLNFILYCSHRY